MPALRNPSAGLPPAGPRDISDAQEDRGCTRKNNTDNITYVDTIASDINPALRQRGDAARSREPRVDKNKCPCQHSDCRVPTQLVLEGSSNRHTLLHSGKKTTGKSGKTRCAIYMHESRTISKDAPCIAKWQRGRRPALSASTRGILARAPGGGAGQRRHCQQ